jgi:hypothetical protein
LYTTFLAAVGERRDYFGVHDSVLVDGASADGPLSELLA